jgi:hypothetical protein
MAQNKIFSAQPGIIGSAANFPVNLWNYALTATGSPSTGAYGCIMTGTQPYAIFKHIRLTNSLATAAVSVSLYKSQVTIGSLTSQTFAFSSVSIPAQSYVDWYGQARFDSTDWLVGAASLATACIVNIDGELGFA